MAQLNLNYNPGFLPSTSRRLSLLPIDPSTTVDMESNERAPSPTSDTGSPNAEITPPASLLTPTPEIGAPKVKTSPLTSHPKSSYISFAEMPVTSAIFRVFPPGPQEMTALLPAPVSYQPRSRFRRKYASMHALSRTYELVAGLLFVVVFFVLFTVIVASHVEVEDFGRGAVAGSETTVNSGLQKHWTWELMGWE